MNLRKGRFVLLLSVTFSLFQFSRAVVFTFSKSCHKLQADFSGLLKSSECERLMEDPSREIYNHMNLLHMSYNLQHSELVLIIADNMTDGIILARFLSNGNRIHPMRRRTEFVNEQLAAFDFIFNNVHIYENSAGPSTFFVYPRQSSDEGLAKLLALEVLRNAKNIKVILTSPDFSSYHGSENKNGVFDVAGQFFRNPKELDHSFSFVVTTGKYQGSKNSIFDIETKRHDYQEMIVRYLQNPDATENGKSIVKLIVGAKKNIIFLSEFSWTKSNEILAHLKNLQQTPVNTRDYENANVLISDCISNFAETRMTSVMDSLQSAVILKLSEEMTSVSTLSGVWRLSRSLNLLYERLSSFLNCTITQAMDMSGCFKNLSNHLQDAGIEKIDDILSRSESYLSLLCIAFQQASFAQTKVEEYVNKPEKWTLELKKYMETLKNMMDWYQKLVLVFDNVDNTRKANISETFANLWNNAETFQNVNEMKAAYETVKSNAIKTKANFTCVRVSDVMKLQVTGKFLKLSQILNRTRCSIKIKILEIFALEKIIIDQDLIADSEGLDVFIFAPIWEIVSNRNITLDGVSRNQIQQNLNPKARNGNKLTNRNGANGEAGMSGGAGGTFFGLAQTIISAENLKISVNGGNGSHGQDGGDAADSEDGETPSIEFLKNNFNHHRCVWPRNKQFIYHIERPEKEYYYNNLIGPPIQLKYKKECYIFGLEGYPGGHGGHGGVRGRGGMAGNCKLFSLDDSSELPVVLSTANGTDGNQGLGGKAGKGGFTSKVTVHNHDYFEYSFATNKTNIRARDGQDGVNNFSIVGKKLTIEPKILQTFAQTANLYKRFILSNIGNNRDSKYIDLYKLVIGNKKILETYDTLTLVDELMDLEQHYYMTNNKSDTLFLYQSWKERLDYYSTHRKDEEITDEYNEVLRTLRSIVTEKIKRLVKSSQSFLIFMLSEYLLETQQQVRHLQNAKTVVVIKNTNSKYTEEYDDKIEEAQRIIQEDLQNNLTMHNDELTGEMEMLLSKIGRLVDIESKNAEDLVKKSGAMQKNALIKTFNDIISIINTGLGIINPALATIGTKISAAGSMVQNFFDESADADIVEVMIPNMVKKSGDFFNNWVEMKKEFQKLAIDESLDMIKKGRQDLSSKGRNVEPLRTIEKSFTELKDLVEKETVPAREVLKTLSENIETEESLWEQMNIKKKYIYTEALKVVKHLKTYTTVKQLFGDLLKKCEDLKNPKRIDGISNQIQAAFEKTRKLRNFKEEVLNKMLPLLQKIRKSSNVGDQLESSSVAFLDFKKFQMHQYFETVLNQIGFFARDLKMESYFEKTLKKMQSVVDMILSIYTRIEEYVETMKKADYEKDLSLAPFDITYVKDPKLSMALAKMVQMTYANIVLDDSLKWMASFKQYIFPFADEFLGVYESSIPEVDDLLTNAQDAGDQLEFYGSLINKKRAQLREFENTVITRFGYSLPPFHVWNKEDYSEEIKSILSGNMVTLFANISKHKNLNAVKFSDVWLRLGSSDPGLVEEMKQDLKGFAVILKHNGDSHYRCDERIFLISSGNHQVEKVFSDEKVENFNDNGGVKMTPTTKGTSDFILSPYATWTIQITSRDKSKKFADLEKYKSKVNIELVGLGQYSDKNLQVCTTNLSKYYENEL